MLAATVTIAMVVGKHRGIEFASIFKRSASAPVVDRQTVPQPRRTPAQPGIGGGSAAQNFEIVRLQEALRSLSAERDRLEERLSKLEQGLGDITASIDARPAPASTPALQDDRSSRSVTAASGPSTSELARHGVPPAGNLDGPGGGVFLRYVTAAPLVVPPSAGQAPMQIHAVARAEATPSRNPNVTRTEFALDLGGEPNVDALRARWASLRATHGALVGEFRPLVHVREGKRPDSVELRLIAGPIFNAEDAARVCVSLQTRGVNCATVTYEGQRLALH